MSGWGDDYELQLQQDTKIDVNFMINFKRMSHIIDRIVEETGEWDDKHPKTDLLKIWASVMFVFLVLFTLSYSVLTVATGIFFFFYGYVLIQLASAWKRFKYSGRIYWAMTLITMIASLILGLVLQGILFG